MALELLQAVKEGAEYGSIKLKDVESVLSNEVFTNGEGLLTMTENKSTLLHLAAACKDGKVLPLVCQAYSRAKLYQRALMMTNNREFTPIHVAISCQRFENVILLFKDCQEVCPQALQPAENGLTLFHSALQGVESLNIVKFFLSQKQCLPLLLYEHKSGSGPPELPLGMAKTLVIRHQSYVKFAEDVYSKSTMQNQMHYNVSVAPKKKALEKAKELLSCIEQPTMEMKAEESKKQAKKLEKTKIQERMKQISTEMEELMSAADWQTIEEKYLLVDSEETKKIAVGYLAERIGATDGGALSFTLPPLSLKLLEVLTELMKSSGPDDGESDPLAAIKLLEVFTQDRDNNSVIVESQESLPVMSLVVSVMCAMDEDLQCTCASVISNFFSNLPDNYEAAGEENEAVQPLLLLRHFSSCEEAKRLAATALSALGVEASREPDPGTWTEQHVSYWMQNSVELDGRSEYSKAFSSAGIDGLHLLELSTAEIAGLGVKYVSHQRKLMSLIDDLRRRNARLMVGRKDVFLSYAHIDIKFAKRIKKVLNEEKYTVWIDGAGIRAGHKWRNEIADGIQSAKCVVFIMSPRSANSEYCQDEIALSEEYHKPIITIRLRAAQEMDPGLKLTLGRRQWLDFTNQFKFSENKASLITTVHNIIGPGSGPEIEESRPQPAAQTSVTKTSSSSSGVVVGLKERQGSVTSEGGVALDTIAVRQLVMELVAEEFGKLRTEVNEKLERMNSRLEQLSERVDRRY